MQTLKHLFNNKTILIIGGVLLLASLFPSGVSAEGIHQSLCMCRLAAVDSVCSQEAASHSICIDKTFIDNVVNQAGVNFDLRDGTGADLGKVRVRDNEFTISGTQKVYLSNADGAKINNENLNISITAEGHPQSFVAFLKTNIGEGPSEVGAKSLNVTATNAVNAANRWLGAEESVILQTAERAGEEGEQERIFFGNIYVPTDPFNADSVTMQTAGVIKQYGGGDIYVQAPEGSTGPGGSISLRGKTIYAGTINAAGNPDSGQVSIEAENASFGDIVLHSIEGWVAPAQFSDNLTVPANQLLSINGLGGNNVGSFKAETVYLQAADSITDLNITAEDRISFQAVSAYSGCIPGTTQEIEDYPDKPKRKICQVGNSGNINLEVTGEWGDGGRGILIKNKIDNDAIASEGASPGSDPESVSGGEGFAGDVILKATNALVSPGRERGIFSRGFHLQEIAGVETFSIHLRGRFIYFGFGEWGRLGIRSSSVESEVFPEEITRWPLGVAREEVGGANVKIEPVIAPLDSTLAEGCVPGEKGGCLAFGSIETNGDHPFAPNGGKVIIRSDVLGRLAYRVDALHEVPGDDNNFFEIHTEGAGLSTLGSRYDVWYIRDGLSRKPDGTYVAWDNNDFDNFCNNGNEYINGVNAGINQNGLEDAYTKYADGLDGGDGGDIIVQARMIQPYRYEPRVPLLIKAQGGSGSRGGHGGMARYCSSWNFPNLTLTHNIPEIGWGGEGGDGGQGGSVTFETASILNVTAKNFHCLTKYEVFSNGGIGGGAGNTETSSLQSLAGWGIAFEQGHDMGTCDLAGAQSYPKVPEMKTPAKSGDGGDAGNVVLNPMPTDSTTPINSALVESHGGSGGNNTTYLPPYPYYCADVNFDPGDPEAGNATHASLYMDSYIEMENCKEGSERSMMDCRDKCEQNTGNPYNCGCYDYYEQMAAQCEYVTNNNRAAQPFNWQYAGVQYTIDPRPYGPPGQAQILEGDPRCFVDSDFDSRENCHPRIPQIVCMRPWDKNTGGGGFTSNERDSEGSGYYVLSPNNVGAGKLLEAVENKPVAAMAAGQSGAAGGNGGSVTIDTRWVGGAKEFKVFGGNGGSGTEGQFSYISQPGDGGSGGAGGSAGSVTVWNADEYVNDSLLYGGNGGSGGLAGTTNGGDPMRDAGMRIGNGFAFSEGDEYCDNKFWDWAKAPPGSRDVNCEDDRDCNLNEECEGGDCVEKFACDAAGDLVSCRTKDPFGPSYSSDAKTVRVDLEAANGVQGAGGTAAAVSSGAGTQQANVCASGAGGVVEPIVVTYADWTENETEGGGDCCNGIDEDLDGLIDCQDPDCEQECFGAGGFLMGRDKETWDRECQVVICNDEHDNDSDVDIDIEDPSDCIFQDGNTPPEAQDLTFQQTGGCEERPVVRLSWTYYDENNDPVGEDPQTMYEVQVATDSAFNNLVISGEQTSGSNSVDYSTLEYGTQYWWQVRVKDSNDAWGDWTTGASFDAEEWPHPQFNYRVSQWGGEEWGEFGSWQGCNYTYQSGPCTTLVDNHQLKLGFQNTTENCPNGCDYTWYFGDGDTSSAENPPDHTYPLNNTYNLKLEARDSANPDHECYQTMVIELGAGDVNPPEWREIAPF